MRGVLRGSWFFFLIPFLDIVLDLGYLAWELPVGLSGQSMDYGTSADITQQSNLNRRPPRPRLRPHPQRTRPP